MNVLSIGNSFSQDAQRYLHRIAKADGVTISSFNLYIGGCPLSLHYRNMMSEDRAYALEMNGESTGFKVSLKEALLNRDWDVVTLQQASHKSTSYETYEPYIMALADYVRALCPKAKIAIHETWAYEKGSQRLNEVMGYTEHTEMLKDLRKAYLKAFDETGADIFIPSGDVMQKLLESGIEKVHRDTYHLSYGLGRYAAGLLWYTVLTGNNIADNTFSDFDEEISKEEVEIIKLCISNLK